MEDYRMVNLNCCKKYGRIALNFSGYYLGKWVESAIKEFLGRDNSRISSCQRSGKSE